MMKMTHLLTLLFLLLFTMPTALLAGEDFVPRFVTTKSDEVNVRAGPNVRYPINMVLVRKHLPLEVIAEFEQWRKIRDIEGEEGWIHKGLLRNARYVILEGKDTLTLLHSARLNSRPVVRVEPGVIASVTECTVNWCKLKVDGYKGWIEKPYLFGVFDHEVFD